MLGAAADRQVYQLVTYTLEGDLTTIELQLKAAELHYWSANLLTEIKKECLQLHCTLTAKWRTEEKKNAYGSNVRLLPSGLQKEEEDRKDATHPRKDPCRWAAGQRAREICDGVIKNTHTSHSDNIFLQHMLIFSYVIS